MYGSISAFDRCYEALNFENLKINASEDFMSTNLLATANYNYRTSRYVELSAGLGVGGCMPKRTPTMLSLATR